MVLKGKIILVMCQKYGKITNENLTLCFIELEE